HIQGNGRVLVRYGRIGGTVTDCESGARRASLSIAGTGSGARRHDKASAEHIRACSGKAEPAHPFQWFCQFRATEPAKGNHPFLEDACA
ncbi:hypothetical protein NQ272_27350, partial [Escherichia coli]|nr:hypothetical protein [Escherichia coli]